MGHRGENEYDKLSKQQQKWFEPMLSRLTVLHSTADLLRFTWGHLSWHLLSLLSVFNLSQTCCNPYPRPLCSIWANSCCPSSRSCTSHQTIMKALQENPASGHAIGVSSGRLTSEETSMYWTSSLVRDGGRCKRAMKANTN